MRRILLALGGAALPCLASPATAAGCASDGLRSVFELMNQLEVAGRSVTEIRDALKCEVALLGDRAVQR